MAPRGRPPARPAPRRPAPSRPPVSPAGKKRVRLWLVIPVALVVLVFGGRFAMRHMGRITGGGGASAVAVGGEPAPDGTTPSVPMAGTILGQCTAPGASTESCVGNALEGALHTNGERTAFALLARMRASPALEGSVYRIARQLGRAGYQVSGPSKALADCPNDMGSGCSHGVVEQLFASRGPTADMTKLCSKPIQATPLALHRCWHAVGHGLYMANSSDWRLSVKQCSAIADPIDRAECTTGVFMQGGLPDESSGGEITAGTMAETESPAAKRAKAEFAAHAGDPLYPCNAVTDRDVAAACWRAQPQTVLRVSRGSFERAFSVCAGAGANAAGCEEGIGTAAALKSKAGAGSPVSACDASPRAAAPWRHCMAGAVKEVIAEAGSIAPGVAVCRTVGDDAARDCYSTIGMMNLETEPRPDSRVAACSSVPDAYKELCAGSSKAEPATTAQSPR